MGKQVGSGFYRFKKIELKVLVETVTPEQLADVTRSALAEVVILDWDGLTNNGEPFLFDREYARNAITSKNGARFADIVLSASMKLDSKVNDYVESASKNS